MTHDDGRSRKQGIQRVDGMWIRDMDLGCRPDRGDVCADVEFGRLQARDLLQHLWTGPISNAPVDIVQGSKSVEVRPVGFSKVSFSLLASFHYPAVSDASTAQCACPNRPCL